MREDERIELSTKKESQIADTEPLWNFLGLRVARKTEIIALAAFTLSLGGVLWQIENLARGPVITLFSPDQIIIATADKLGRNYPGQPNLLLLIASMTYVNSGNTGHNAIIRRENISFSLEDREVEHQGDQFGYSDIKDGNLVFHADGPARPFPINASSAVTHETLFAAWPVQCDGATNRCDPRRNFVKWDDFLKEIKITKRFSVTMSAEVYSSGPVSAAACTVRLPDGVVKILEQEQWYAVTCIK
jgi:hypothetical protein